MREKIRLNDGWLFHKGDINTPRPTDKGPVYMQSKTERKLCGPAARHYFDSPDTYRTDIEIRSCGWRSVTLPHDYIIDQTPSKDENNTTGYFHYCNAWYRKHFKLNPEDKNRRLTLLFEGVATHAVIYLNGCLLKRNFCAYTTFEVDITDYACFDRENVLAVYVSTDEFEGWWYQGGGIYRNVWLIKTDLVAIDLWGVYAVPRKLSETAWAVDFETTVLNGTGHDVKASVLSEICDGTGKTVASAAGEGLIPAFGKAVVRYTAKVSSPRIWDIDDPYLYTVRTALSSENGAQSDEEETRIGFRTFHCDPDKGFFLNGRHVVIKGVCAHQDFGLTGLAVPENIIRYKVQLLKEMGANGFRTTHYPHPEAAMDAFDEQGFLVMDETRWFDSSDEGKRQLEMLIRRDRNRPSVVFWSTGNEEPGHITETGRRINRTMISVIRKLDRTRPITCAISVQPDQATILSDLDLIGINYNLDLFDKIHAEHPHKAIFSSECCAASTTRGWYFPDSPERGYLSAYDQDSSTWFRGREATWKFLSSRKYVMGGFQWDAFEHRGETHWPRLCSQSGAIDLYLQKKDAFYQNQSHWTDQPMIHILPHWNQRGLEGRKIHVWAYTNCCEAELFLNGESLGRQTIDQYGHGEWTVTYRPGTLKCVGYRKGARAATDTVETTGEPQSLRLTPMNKAEANGRDIALFTCECLDMKGRAVPDAEAYVRFSCNKNGRVIATGSDVCDPVPPSCPERRMRAGKITVAVRAGNEKGPLTLYAESDRLGKAAVTINLSR